MWLIYMKIMLMPANESLKIVSLLLNHGRSHTILLYPCKRFGPRKHF